jgi:hypothetical protein
MKLFSHLTVTVLSLITLTLPAFAQTSSTTLDGLPNFLSAGVPTARINTLTVTLAPDTGPIHGPRGTTVGWGFSITWQSNAGDKIAFTGSRLVGDTSALTTGYVDYIGKLSGKTNGSTAAGETWERTFVENKGGLGAVPIRSSAKPGSGYVGQLRLTFDVYDSRGPALGETLGTFEMLLDVSVLVDSEDPVDQTITFNPIANTTYGGASFTVNATASSGLPVTLTSLNPEVCTIAGNTVTVVNAGTCTLLAAQDGDTQYNPAPLVTQSFEVAKAAASVTITGALTQTYNGTPKSLAGQPQPGGLNVKVLYSGDATPPTTPGLYFVKAFIDEPNYQGFAETDFTIVDTRPPVLTTFGQWLSGKFDPLDLGNPLVVGGTADPDSDAIQNSFEYAMGFHPKNPATAAERDALPRVSVTPVDRTLYFSIPDQAGSDVTFVVESSPDLTQSNWQEIARRAGNGLWSGAASVFSGASQNSRIPILVTEPAIPAQERRFYRLRAIVE